MKRTLIESIVLLALLYALIIIAASENLAGLSIKTEIDPVSLASLTVTIFIAFFLQYFFASRATDLRVEKDFIIQVQKEVVKAAKDSRDAVDASIGGVSITTQSKSKILLAFRDLANSLEALEEVLLESKCRSLATDFAATKTFYYQFKSTATAAPFPSKPYSPQMRRELDIRYRQLRKNLQVLFFKVNNFH
jgi:hypothetical protein